MEASNGGGLQRGDSRILFQANSSGETQNTHPITPTLVPGLPHCHPFPAGPRLKLYDKSDDFEFLTDPGVGF